MGMYELLTYDDALKIMFEITRSKCYCEIKTNRVIMRLKKEYEQREMTRIEVIALVCLPL